MSFFDKFTKKGSAAFAPSMVLPAVMEALTEEGFRPVRESATLVKYAEGSILSYFCYREDEPDFLMAQANFERGAFGTEEELLLLRACAKTNCLQKAGKATSTSKAISPSRWRTSSPGVRLLVSLHYI